MAGQSERTAGDRGRRVAGGVGPKGTSVPSASVLLAPALFLLGETLMNNENADRGRGSGWRCAQVGQGWRCCRSGSGQREAWLSGGRRGQRTGSPFPVSTRSERWWRLSGVRRPDARAQAVELETAESKLLHAQKARARPPRARSPPRLQGRGAVRVMTGPLPTHPPRQTPPCPRTRSLPRRATSHCRASAATSRQDWGLSPFS